MEHPIYHARVIETIEHGPGESNTLVVGVFRTHSGQEEQIGSYERNYDQLFRTFAHFRKNGNDYALYSPLYTATRIMELPSCRDMGGESPATFGFCPVDYYVPWHDPDEPDELYPVDFGLIAGCIWGDDSSWKIQYLDLSTVEDGNIKRDERFGYIELPENLTLDQAVGLFGYSPDDDYQIQIAITHRFNLKTGKDVG